MRSGGAVAVFSATALATALVAGFGLGVWLLLARTWGVPLFGASWLVLVQVHGLVQLFGFAGLFLMGVALHALPRFRGAPPAPARLVIVIFAATLTGLAVRALAQPFPDGPVRGSALTAGALLLTIGTGCFAAAALRILGSGRNPHRADELVIAAGVLAMPVAAALEVVAVAGRVPSTIAQTADDRVLAAMLLGSLATAIVGVWARLAPGFVATPPARAAQLLAGAATWFAGVAAIVAGWPIGPWLLLGGLSLLTVALGVFGPSIARQPLAGAARLTRLAVRSAFAWAFIGVALIAVAGLGTEPAGPLISAARHALGLGFVTMMIYGVGSRALPAFLGRRLWSDRLQLATILLTDLAVALRVGLQSIPSGPGGSLGAAAESVANAVVGLSGLIAYAALVAFAVNVARTVRGPLRPAAPPDGPVRIDATFSTPRSDRLRDGSVGALGGRSTGAERAVRPSRRPPARPRLGSMKRRLLHTERGILAIYVVFALLAAEVLAGVTFSILGTFANPPLVIAASAAAAASAAPTPAASGNRAPAAAASPAPAAAVTATEISRRADDVPPPISRRVPANVAITLETREVVGTLDNGQTYTYWTFDGTVPGPMLRVRVGDTVTLTIKNAPGSTMPHSIDLHAVNGPGGGSGATQTAPGKALTFTFKALNPGLYVYHCATAPIPMHVANGMYGLILVEPEEGLPPVDREFYVVQGEIYSTQPFGTAGNHTFSNDHLLAEHADYVVFNGRVGSLTGDRALTAKVGERVRIFFGDGGFLISSFHVIGEIFDQVYLEGSVGTAPSRNIQTTLVPAGGSTIVEFTPDVPGRYLLVDHNLGRALGKGAAGFLDVTGPANPAIFNGTGGSGH